jgi:hypothetical protein
MLCFIHIERTGGTTLDYILRNNYRSFLILPPQFWTNDPTAEFTPAELRTLLRWLPFTRGFGGHTTRAYLRYDEAAHQPIEYVTFLRDPVTRCLSQFQHQAERLGSLQTFLADPRAKDFMTTRVAGAPDLARAREMLETQFAFVGLTERFDESLLLMRRMLGLDDLDIRYERRNVGRDSSRSASSEGLGDDVEALQLIKASNQLDMELYDFARQTLYRGYVDRYGPALMGDLERFREENDGFRFSRRRRAEWALYRKLIYEPLGRAVTRRRRHLLEQ